MYSMLYSIRYDLLIVAHGDILGNLFNCLFVCYMLGSMESSSLIPDVLVDLFFFCTFTEEFEARRGHHQYWSSRLTH